MRKYGELAGVFVVVAFLVTQAWAGPPMGPPMEPGMFGGGFCEERPPEVKQFCEDTSAEREQMRAKFEEMKVLLENPDSDSAKIGDLAKEIHALRETMREKAEAAGLEPPHRCRKF